MMSAEMATPDLLKIKVFRNKSYYVIDSVYGITYKVLSHESNYIREVCIRNVMITSQFNKRWSI